MLSLLAYVPGIISLFITYAWTVEFAFIYFYLPVLLMLPQIFFSEWGNLPHFSFAQTAIIPIAFGALINRMPLWRFGINDLLLFVFLFCFYYSELISPSQGGYEQLVIQTFPGIIFPYMLAKLLIYPTGNSVNFCKCYVMCMVINIFLSAYELRFSVNPYFHIFLPFFPNAETMWPTLFRFGFVRFGGPFIQSILMGIGIAMACIIHVWLWKNNYWSKYFKWLPLPFISKRFGIAFMLILGMVMTFSRGPIAGLFIGAIFLNLGYTRHLLRALVVSLILFAIGVYYIWDMVQAFYLEELTSGLTQEEENTLYRVALLKEYWEIAWEKPFWGWGVGNIPLLRSMRSIDNQYLWLFLKNGGWITLIYISMFAINILRLFFKGINCSLSTQPKSRSLAFTFFCMYLTLAVSFATVFMGMQTEQIFFMILGWSDAFILAKNPEALLINSDKK